MLAALLYHFILCTLYKEEVCPLKLHQRFTSFLTTIFSGPWHDQELNDLRFLTLKLYVLAF